jgi:hypothetical protein
MFSIDIIMALHGSKSAWWARQMISRREVKVSPEQETEPERE